MELHESGADLWFSSMVNSTQAVPTPANDNENEWSFYFLRRLLQIQKNIAQKFNQSLITDLALYQMEGTIQGVECACVSRESRFWLLEKVKGWV